MPWKPAPSVAASRSSRRVSLQTWRTGWPKAARSAAHEGAFAVHRYDTAAAAREAIEDRTVYGAIVAPGSPP
ncbi:hypothetical protein ACIRTB_15475 [Streptomyces sp. NPDC101158]|uniref:hypothetical protein n=1 Tax=Streptomyces sp. NPDC101158 TaxID=3366117 RepID=UPI00382CD104